MHITIYFLQTFFLSPFTRLFFVSWIFALHWTEMANKLVGI